LDIKNRVIKSDLVDWRTFQFIQPDNFKELSKPNYTKLIASLIKNNFTESFKVWQKGDVLYCLDGYHRCKALSDLEQLNYNVPDKLQADFVECKDRAEAARLILIYSSVYAKSNDERLYEYMNLENITMDEIKIDVVMPDMNMGYFFMGYGQEKKEPQPVTGNQTISNSPLPVASPSVNPSQLNPAPEAKPVTPNTPTQSFKFGKINGRVEQNIYDRFINSYIAYNKKYPDKKLTGFIETLLTNTPII
jgi:hypothetical protein